jgi:hypothetical protein
MTGRRAQSINRCPPGSKETVVHWNERLPDGSQIGIGGESVPPRFHAPDRGVLDGDHARVCLTLVNGAYGARECRNRNHFHCVTPDLRDRVLGVGAAVALKCNPHRQRAGGRITRRVRCRTVPVQSVRFEHDYPDQWSANGLPLGAGSLKREGPRDWRRPGVCVSCVYLTARATGAPIGCSRGNRNNRSC